MKGLGVVSWFDNQSGEGKINFDGKLYYVHYSAIDEAQDGYYGVLFKDQEVYVEVNEDPGQVKIVRGYDSFINDPDYCLRCHLIDCQSCHCCQCIEGRDLL